MALNIIPGRNGVVTGWGVINEKKIAHSILQAESGIQDYFYLTNVS